MEPSAKLCPDTRATGSTRWRRADALSLPPGDPALAGWLTHAGSLTRRLQQLRPGAFALEVIGEGVEPATPEDAALLGTDERALYTRRIRLRVDGRALVQACTLAPEATLVRHPWLKALGVRPLGAALADWPGVRRTGFEFAFTAGGDGEQTPALRNLPREYGPCAGRRSRFFIADAPILVYEFFLPPLLEFGPP
jgi:chorismate--pyruvate lyase